MCITCHRSVRYVYCVSLDGYVYLVSCRSIRQLWGHARLSCSRRERGREGRMAHRPKRRRVPHKNRERGRAGGEGKGGRRRFTSIKSRRVVNCAAASRVLNYVDITRCHEAHTGSYCHARLQVRSRRDDVRSCGETPQGEHTARLNRCGAGAGDACADQGYQAV